MSVGISSVIAYIIAIAVPLFAIYMIFALDLFGTGKGSTVLIAFAWGALGAFTLALIINNWTNDWLTATIGPDAAYTTVVTRSAPIVEEILKSLVLIYLVFQPRFRYIVDGAVYGFATGIGFSVTENLFYLTTDPALMATNDPSQRLVLAISRVLSSSLMHATASALIGISLGRLRRSHGSYRFVVPLVGLGFAAILHLIFNNLVNTLQGTQLLLVAIGIGIGGGMVIGYWITQGLAEEKKHFKETLDSAVGVSQGERKAVQQLGGNQIEEVLQELGDMFGVEKIDTIRRLLVIQANIGILNGNLRSPTSAHLRSAWEKEIAELRVEAVKIRNDLGIYVMNFLRSVFPADETAADSPLTRAISSADPTVVHTFDMFMNLSAKSGTMTPEALETTARMLQKVEFFKDVSLADLENLSRAVITRTYTDGQMIFNEGDEGDSMYLIQSGAIQLFTKVGKEERLLRTSQSGDVVGELALLDGQKRSAQARASGSLSVLVLSRQHFIDFMGSRPHVILAVLRYLAQRVRYVTTVVETSIAWAGNVAKGDYDKARSTGELAPSAVPRSAEAVSPTDSRPQAATSPTDAKLKSVTAETPLRLGGTFSMIASALEQREKELQKKQQDGSQATLDLSELSELEQTVMKFLMQDQVASNQGISLDMLQAKLTDVPDVARLIADLDKNNWLITMGIAPKVRYKANLNRKRGKVLQPKV